MLDAASQTSLPAPAAEGRRDRRRRELHGHILATAAGLFARDGFDATTVEKIAKEADIAPATFFNHFPTKEDVLREMGGDVFARFHGLVGEQLAREAGTAERLAGFAERGARLVMRAPELTRRVLIAVLRSSRPGESGAELAAMQADFASLLRRGRDGERADVPADLDVELAAEILVSVVIGAMTHWINDPSYPLASRLRRSLGLLSDRLLAPPPLRDRRSVSTPNPEAAGRPDASPARRAANGASKTTQGKTTKGRKTP